MHVDISKCINKDSDSKVQKALQQCEIFEQNQLKARNASALVIQNHFRKYIAKHKESDLY